MSTLLAAEPGRVLAAAAALDVTADEAGSLVRQLQRAEPPCWSAPSHRDYTS